MCISCGKCSTYCEMGIVVRAYAMANLDVKRAACGMCAHMCPRGVLKLEVKPDRFKVARPYGSTQWTCSEVVASRSRRIEEPQNLRQLPPALARS